MPTYAFSVVKYEPGRGQQIDAGGSAGAGRRLSPSRGRSASRTARGILRYRAGNPARPQFSGAIFARKDGDFGLNAADMPEGPGEALLDFRNPGNLFCPFVLATPPGRNLYAGKQAPRTGNRGTVSGIDSRKRGQR